METFACNRAATIQFAYRPNVYELQFALRNLWLTLAVLGGRLNHAKPPKKVLVAVHAAYSPAVFRALGPEFYVATCHSYADALSQLDDQIGFIACAMHFDSGRMFDLLAAAKAKPETRSVPFFVIGGNGTQYSEPILKGIRSAARLLGATDFLDLTDSANDAVGEQAYERLREGIRNLLSLSVHVHKSEPLKR